MKGQSTAVSRRDFVKAGFAGIAATVAAHRGDLRAARGVGLRTAFVVRPLEFGPEGRPDLTADSPVDVAAKDFNDLADQLGG